MTNVYISRVIKWAKDIIQENSIKKQSKGTILSHRIERGDWRKLGKTTPPHTQLRLGNKGGNKKRESREARGTKHN